MMGPQRIRPNKTSPNGCHNTPRSPMTSKSLNLGTARCGIGAVQKLGTSVQATGDATSLRAARAMPTNLADSWLKPFRQSKKNLEDVVGLD
jgi:hypothetical protein